MPAHDSRTHEGERSGAPDLSGILVPAATPFDPDSAAPDPGALQENLAWWIEGGVRGVVIGGSTGEAVFMDRDERRTVLEAAREAVPRDRLLVAGTGAESTEQTLRLTADAARAGADAVLVQPPAYYRSQMTRMALARHYREVADRADVPVILYQVPLRFSTVELSTGLVAELSSHPGIIGIKDSRGELDGLGEYLTHASPGFQVLVGNGAKLYASLELGAVGGILGVANLVPGDAVALHESFREGRTAEAGRLQERIGPLHTKIVGGYGVPGVKAALGLMGLHGGPPRLPLTPLGDGDIRTVRGILEEAELLP